VKGGAFVSRGWWCECLALAFRDVEEDVRLLGEERCGGIFSSVLQR